MASGYDDDRDDRDEPSGDREDGGDDRDRRIIERAKAKIKTPAIVLLVVGVLSLLMGLYFVLSFLTIEQQFATAEETWDNDPNLTPQQRKDLKQKLADSKDSIKAISPLVIGMMLLTAVITILSSVRIMNLKSKGLGAVGSVLSMIPVVNGCCCVFGLPVGIWVLIALGKPEVKAGFAAVAKARQSPDGY